MDSYLLLVIAIEAVFIALFATTVVYVPADARLTRFFSIVALAGLSYLLPETFYQLCSNVHWRSSFVAQVCIQLLSVSDWVLFKRVDSSVISSGTAKDVSFKTKISRAISLIWNLRGVGTKWQVDAVSPYVHGRSISAPENRAMFLVRRSATTLIAFVIVDSFTSLPSPDLALVNPDKDIVTSFSSLSSEDIVVRLIGTAIFWLNLAAVCVLLNNIVAIFCVLTGLSDPAHCPPMHGQFTEAYTIRQFWGVSWHQCLRRGLSSHANFFADSILSLPRGTLLSRYMRIFGAFFLSGLLHQVLDCALGLPFAKAGAIAFFSVQAAGIVVEDAVEALSQTLPFFRNNAWVRRTVGYLWVAGFLVWSTPIWMYPAVRLQLDPTQLFPFHLTMPFLTSGAAVSA